MCMERQWLNKGESSQGYCWLYAPTAGYCGPHRNMVTV